LNEISRQLKNICGDHFIPLFYYMDPITSWLILDWNGKTENNEVKIIWCKAHAYISSYWGWMTKFLFTRSKFSIKNLVKVYFDKVLWSCKPASKTLSKNFDGLCRNKNPSYFSKTVVGFWREVTIFSESRSNSAVLFVFELTTEM